jgi:hypothetical protein
MAKISNTLSYPNQLPIESGDYLIGTAANSSPIEKQTKTFTLGDIANFIIDGAFDGVSYRIPVFTAATSGVESFTIVNSLLYQDTASNGDKPEEVGGTTVYVDNGSGQGNFYVAGTTTTNGLLTVDGGIYFNSEVFDSSNTVGTGEQVLVSQADGTVQWQNYQGSGLEFQGGWNANTNVPDLTDPALLQPANTGKYWVVSVAGTTSLPTQGGGNITDWEVGDWAIISEDLNNNIFWDKIDNSSVLTGQGTPGNLAIWVTDSELGDAQVKVGVGDKSLIFNDLAGNLADGNAANAMGESTTASGNHSTAIGLNTTASGQSSTAMGQDSTASGDQSTAMGELTTASGDFSTAMGQNTLASGETSTAMGRFSKASGNFSTAMGEDTEASGKSSTAMGELTKASGDYAVSLGTLNNADGNGSVALGQGNNSTGVNSTALGLNNTASGNSSTAMGSGTTASGVTSTAIGNGSEATGNYSVAIGQNLEATGTISLAMGNGSEASNTVSVAIGNRTEASGTAALALGEDTIASGNNSTATGASTTASGDFSFSAVKSSKATGTASVAIGSEVEAAGQFALALGVTSKSSGAASIAIGNQAQALSNDSVAIGNQAIAQTNEKAIAIGTGSNAQGENSFAIGAAAVTNATASFGFAIGNQASSSGTNAFAIGEQSAATTARAMAFGKGAEASGFDSLALGSDANATGIRAVAIGDSTAVGQRSVAIGLGNVTNAQSSVAVGTDNNVNEDGGVGHFAAGYSNTVNDIAVADPGNGNFAIGFSNTISGSVGVIGEQNNYQITNGGVGRKAIIVGNNNTGSGLGSIIVGNNLTGIVGANQLILGGTQTTRIHNSTNVEIARFTDSQIRFGKGLTITDNIGLTTTLPSGSLMVGPYSGNQSLNNTSIGSMIVGAENQMQNAPYSAILGQSNTIDGTGVTNSIRSHIIGYNNSMTGTYSSFIAGGNSSVTTVNNGFSLGYSNSLSGQDSMFAFGENNTGPNGANDRNSFMIGAQLVGSDKTMNLGFRNNTAEYPATDINNGLGDVTFSVSTGLNTNTNSNALLITEGGINSGNPSVPQIPRVILPTVVSFNFADDTAAAAGGIPVGGLYHNAGVLRIRIA